MAAVIQMPDDGNLPPILREKLKSYERERMMLSAIRADLEWMEAKLSLEREKLMREVARSYHQRDAS